MLPWNNEGTTRSDNGMRASEAEERINGMLFGFGGWRMENLEKPTMTHDTIPPNLVPT